MKYAIVSEISHKINLYKVAPNGENKEIKVSLKKIITS